MRYKTREDALRDHPTRKPKETAKTFLRRTLKQHRAIHADWLAFIERGGKAYGDTSIEYERYAVERYDELLGALKELA
jgi:hypothetical protein